MLLRFNFRTQNSFMSLAKRGRHSAVASVIEATLYEQQPPAGKNVDVSLILGL